MTPDQKGLRLYNEFAHLWPVISPPQDYAEESEHWRSALRDLLGPGRWRILELGCGGGHLLSHLTADFEAEAVDLAPRMLALSRKLNPDVEHHLGDMRTVRIPGEFDAVLAHDAISYMLSEDDLRAVLATARVHLRPGGVFLAAPDLVRDTFRPRVLRWPGRPPSKPDEPTVTVEEHLRDPDPADTVIESLFVYTIVENGVTRVAEDLHLSGLFPIATWMQLLEEAGFDPEVMPLPGDGDGCGETLFRGVLRGPGLKRSSGEPCGGGE